MGESSHPLNRAVFISSNEDPGWLSLRRIRQNLLDTYRILDPKLRLVSYRWRSIRGAERLAESVENGAVKKLIFLGSNPRVRGLGPTRARVKERCFHVSGDFTRITPEWFEAVSSLVGKSSQFIVASEAQRKQLQVFLGKQNRLCIDVVPFSVNWAEPAQVASKRSALLTEFGFAAGDFIITYGGRVSQQKNVNLLLDFVKRFIEDHPKLGARIKVAIAGGFDDIGQYFVNQYFHTGEYSQYWTSWFDGQPSWFKKRVRYVGFLDQSRLEKLYSASGVFASLSTFHDEDFGMAPLEALGMGCPALLSGWGGYADFADEPEHARLVAVRNTSAGLSLNYRQFAKHLLHFIQTEETSLVRKHRALHFRERYSIESTARALLSAHQRKIPNLKEPAPLLKEHADRVRKMRRGQGQVFKSMSSKDSFYKQIYGCYVARC